MSMNAAQTAQTLPAGSQTPPIREFDRPGISTHNVGDVAAPVDEYTDLAPHFETQFCELAGEIVRHQPFGRQPATVQAFELANLARLESVRVAKDLNEGSFAMQIVNSAGHFAAHHGQSRSVRGSLQGELARREFREKSHGIASLNPLPSTRDGPLSNPMSPRGEGSAKGLPRRCVLDELNSQIPAARRRKEETMATPSSSIAALILAAGQGTRMKSRLSKVLHPLAGSPMLDYPLKAAEALKPDRLIVVVGRDAEQVEQTFGERATFVLQQEQRGTGHAVLSAQAALEGFSGDVLILYGDTPLLRSETLLGMVRAKADSGADLLMLTARVDVPGIVIRDSSGAVARVVEQTDATPEEQVIEERNTGVYLVSSELLWKTLAQVGDRNEQGEIYLTTLIERLVGDGRRVEALQMADADEAIGVNTRVELAAAAAVVRQRKLHELMLAGVTIVDPANTYVDVGVEIGRDTIIEPGCVIQGETRIGEGVHLKPGCMIESSRIADDVVMGPNAHLRPDCVIGRGCRIGNYVELKNSVLGDGVKADHLSYIGDADVGAGASFGCGAITVNYNWKEKNRTTVGEGATIGCNVNLMAPVSIGRNAAVAAGSTIGQEVPDDALAVERSRQRNVEGWVSRRENEKSR
jgi:bifunctional UDP-N-acetylglucosamine pyrophosphorylase/glucosamine-1-phosphate N-acetyltransferase